MTDTTTTPSPAPPRLLRRPLAVAASLAAAPIVAALLWAFVLDGEGRRGLGHVVRDACRPMQRWTGRPFPCLEVNEAGGWARLRAPLDPTQLLIVPLAPIRGIEDPASRAPDAADVWTAAWAARDRVGAALGRRLPDDAVMLAVNSQESRTQDQYHVHIECIAPRPRETLRREAAAIGRDWRRIRPASWTHDYLVRRIDLDELRRARPEAIILAEHPAFAEVLSSLSIAVVALPAVDGAAAGLALAVTIGRPGIDGGHAEELMDHTCRVADDAPRPTPDRGAGLALTDRSRRSAA